LILTGAVVAAACGGWLLLVLACDALLCWLLARRW